MKNTYQEAAFRCRFHVEEAMKMSDTVKASKHMAKAFRKLLRAEKEMKQWIVRHFGSEKLIKIWMAMRTASVK